MTKTAEHSTKTLRPRAMLLAVFCILLWGSAIPCVKLSYPLFGIENGSPFDRIFFAGIRFSGAGIVTLALSFMTKSRVNLQRRHVLPVLGLGLVQTTAQYVCFYLGLAHCPGARSSILNTAFAFFTVFLAALFFRSERVTFSKIAGCLLGFSGIVFVHLGGGIGSRFAWNGDFLIILASFFFALGSIFSKKLSQSENPLHITGVQLLFGGAVLVGVGIIGGGSLPVIVPSGAALLGYLILLSAVAFSIWTNLLRQYDAASVSIYFFLLPGFGVALSGLLLKERIFTFQNLAALLFVCAGIYTVNRPDR
jgi:drug/metabolite transporter (DMT)-like permease